MYSLNDVRMLRFGNLLYGIITCFSHLSGEIDSGNPMLFDRLRLILKNNGLITKWKGEDGEQENGHTLPEHMVIDLDYYSTVEELMEVGLEKLREVYLIPIHS